MSRKYQFEKYHNPVTGIEEIYPELTNTDEFKFAKHQYNQAKNQLLQMVDEQDAEDFEWEN